MVLDQKGTILDLQEKVRTFIEERDWSKYHKPKDMAISITIKSSELLERFQWLSDGEI
jgi:hypothetical protein